MKNDNEVRYIKMTAKEQEEWISSLAELCVETFIEENLLSP
tara:strand:- start:440 stop:562 length:123 start_codon:yes stop_codon:yes gene_type:complete